MFRRLLAIDLDGADAREVFLDEIAQGGQGLLLAPLLAHHAAAKQAHHHQHHRVKPNGGQAQPGVNRQHRRQGEGIGEGRVGEAEDGEAEQAPHVFHITGRPADHLTTAGGLHPAGLLFQQVVENLLLEIGLHLAAHPKDQHPGNQPYAPHHGGQHHDQRRCMQQIAQGKSVLQVVDHLPDQQGYRDTEHVDNHQRQGPKKDGLSVGAQVAPDEIGSKGAHVGGDHNCRPT